YLKYKGIDVDFEDSFKNLIFYLYKENDYENKKLIDFLLGKAKEVIFDKKDKDILSKEEVKNWVKDFGENGKTIIKNNPISYFIEILKGNNGEKILEEFLKLLKTFSDKKDEFEKFLEYDIINKFFKKQEKSHRLISGLTSIFAGFRTVKEVVENIIIKYGKKFLNVDNNGMLTILVEFINALRNIVNKNEFKNKYKQELDVLYILFSNIIEIFFANYELDISIPIPGFNWLFQNFIINKFKITDIITPNTIKEWIENKNNKINES
ncbi:hypothetical protein, partial [Mycoplasma phocimorsus]|uniref:hypothetical protein n=1 Tax=Mycoplasma phocimorsus TaxID=3045839 RepID=UPI0024C094CB